MCRILLAWHFDHAHARRPPPADRAAARDPTAAPATAATAGPGPGRDTHSTPRRRNSGGVPRPCSRKAAAKGAAKTTTKAAAKGVPLRPEAQPPGGPRAGHGGGRTTTGRPWGRRPCTVLLPRTGRPPRALRRRGSGRPAPGRLTRPVRGGPPETTARHTHPGLRRARGRPGSRAGTVTVARAVRVPWAVRIPQVPRVPGRAVRPRSERGLSDGRRWRGRSPREARVLRRPGGPARGTTSPRGAPGRSWRLRRHRGARALLDAWPLRTAGC